MPGGNLIPLPSNLFEFRLDRVRGKIVGDIIETPVGNYRMTEAGGYLDRLSSEEKEKVIKLTRDYVIGIIDGGLAPSEIEIKLKA